MKKMIIHDLNEAINFSDCDVIGRSKISKCIGCFSCWLKKPLHCCFNDSTSDIGARLSSCSEIVIVSRNDFGCFSSFVKSVLERSISYVEPYFTLRNGEIHHKDRSHSLKKANIIFYGNGNKFLASKLVDRVMLNLNIEDYSIIFSMDDIEAKEILNDIIN